MRLPALITGVRVDVVPRLTPPMPPSPVAFNFINKRVFARLQQLRIVPAELADDRTFIRRVYIDTIGLLPTAEEVTAFLADGKVLGVAAGDGCVLIVDPEKRNIAATWDAHKRECLSLAFANDGRILTGGHDGVARLWKGDGTKVIESTGYSGSTFRVAFSHSDSEAFSSDWSGQVGTWKLADGSELSRLTSQ